VTLRTNWIFGSHWVPDSKLDLDAVKQIAPSWGSWRSWRACRTDNVICHDPAEAKKLLARAFQAVCNFYLPRSQFQELNRPVGVRLYDGDYREEATDIDDIIAMHLVVKQSDLVLIAGINLASPVIPADPMDQHRLRNRFGLIRSIIANNPKVQWVLVDHVEYPDPAFLNLPNLTRDNMKSVLKLLA